MATIGESRETGTGDGGRGPRQPAGGAIVLGLWFFYSFPILFGES
jgi:hypothetical protein